MDTKENTAEGKQAPPSVVSEVARIARPASVGHYDELRAHDSPSVPGQAIAADWASFFEQADGGLADIQPRRDRILRLFARLAQFEQGQAFKQRASFSPIARSTLRRHGLAQFIE